MIYPSTYYNLIVWHFFKEQVVLPYMVSLKWLCFYVFSHSSSLCWLSNQWFTSWPGSIHPGEVCNVEWMWNDRYCNLFRISLFQRWLANQCNDLLGNALNSVVNEVLLWTNAQSLSTCFSKVSAFKGQSILWSRGVAWCLEGARADRKVRPRKVLQTMGVWGYTLQENVSNLGAQKSILRFLQDIFSK